MRVRITESLDINLTNEMFCCNRCGYELISATKNYKEGCLILDRNPAEIYQPLVENEPYSFSPDPSWCKIVEIYCPQCGIMFENEILPIGHPLTYDLEVDIEKLKKKHAAKLSK